ncbi:MAG: dienelactone hydrolase family protein [Caulobacteraceae bacterium]
MIERQIDISTADGAMSTFVTHPERDGPHPVILFYMDAPAIREELRDMARRLAAVGYCVMLPNLYYREGVMELGSFSRDEDAPVRAKMMELMGTLTIPRVMEDTHGLLAHAAADPAADETRVGAVGYCMSGQFAISAAAAFPDQVRAAASIYGVRLVTDRIDSPHVVAANVAAELYFACAETDSWAPMTMVRALAAAMAAAPVRAEVEVYPGVEHGFAFPQRAAYDRTAAERHWERLFALFERALCQTANGGKER